MARDPHLRPAALALLLLLHAPSSFAAEAAQLARQIVDAGFDPGECYRVRDLHFSADRAKFFFSDGYLILGRLVDGRRISALFSTDVEGGDAEVLLLPPNRAERQSLADHTGSPNLDEHFTAALMLFSPDVLARFTEQLQSNPAAHKAPEMGALLDSRFSSVAHNVSASFDVRLTWSLLAPDSHHGYFAALLSGKKLGNFDVVYDPLATEQITVGATTFRDDRTLFETWTSFSAQAAPLPQFAISDYRITATIHPDLSLEAVTRYRLRPATASPAVPIEMSNLMNITEARIDGDPAEVLEHDDLRARLIRHSGTELSLAVAAKPLDPGRDHEIEIHHRGQVSLDAGNQVYYVASRANWYPGWETTYTRYDLTFRVPKALQIVLPGEPVSETIEGDERVVHHRIDDPVRIAGFNLGAFDKTSVVRSGFTVDVYANRAFERALQPPPPVFLPPVPPPTAGRRPHLPALEGVDLAPVTPQNPRARLQALASAIAGAMDYFTSLFGPPPLHRLEVTPLPGTLGQGFPGLIYISTLSYLSNAAPSVSPADQQRRLFFEELLQPHEAAHQWWGNVVYSADYHDEWITESLANYSALLYLEKQHGGRKVSDAILSTYRDQLLAGDIDATGPIVRGRRLNTALKPSAWRVITYGKGTWILHMLRARMGDPAFFKMLAALRQDFERREISTEQFRLHCAKFLPTGMADTRLEAFFDQWVYNTGIPQLKLTWSARPGRVTGTVTQSGVGEDFSVFVPIEIRAGAKVIRKMVRTDNDGAPFAFSTVGAATKVTLDPDNSILRRP